MIAHGSESTHGIVIILLAALLIYLLIRSTKQPSPPREAGAETPLDIEKKRYARGEITKASSRS
jgi:uncharacterized membrane protein